MKAQTSGGTVCAPLLIYIPPPPSVTWIPDAELVPQLYSLSGPVCVLDRGLPVSRAVSRVGF